MSAIRLLPSIEILSPASIDSRDTAQPEPGTGDHSPFPLGPDRRAFSLLLKIRTTDTPPTKQMLDTTRFQVGSAEQGQVCPGRKYRRIDDARRKGLVDEAEQPIRAGGELRLNPQVSLDLFARFDQDSAPLDLEQLQAEQPERGDKPESA